MRLRTLDHRSGHRGLAAVLAMAASARGAMAGASCRAPGNRFTIWSPDHADGVEHPRGRGAQPAAAHAATNCCSGTASRRTRLCSGLNRPRSTQPCHRLLFESPDHRPLLKGETQEEDRTARRRQHACGTEGAITSRQGSRRDPEGQDPVLPSTNERSCAGVRSGLGELSHSGAGRQASQRSGWAGLQGQGLHGRSGGQQDNG